MKRNCVTVNTQTCIKEVTFGPKKNCSFKTSDLLKEVQYSFEIFYDMIRKG